MHQPKLSRTRRRPSALTRAARRIRRAASDITALPFHGRMPESTPIRGAAAPLRRPLAGRAWLGTPAPRAPRRASVYTTLPPFPFAFGSLPGSLLPPSPFFLFPMRLLVTGRNLSLAPQHYPACITLPLLFPPAGSPVDLTRPQIRGRGGRAPPQPFPSTRRAPPPCPPKHHIFPRTPGIE